MNHAKHIFLTAALAAMFASGCIPQGEESIRQEIDYVRARAYEDWKEARDRGENETRADGPLSLDDAIKLALQYSKPLQKMVYNREVVRGQRMSAYGIILPSARITAGWTRNEKRQSYQYVDVDNYSVGLNVTQPLWQGDLIPATLRQAQLNVSLTDEEIRSTVQTLISDVSKTYYDVLLAQHMVETYRESLTSAEAQLRMVTEKRRQETATDYDVLRAQVDVATYRAQMISEQNNIDSNRVRILKLLGISQDSDISFSDKLEFLPMRPVFERAVEVASTNRADLRQAEISARVQQEAIRIAQSEFFPYVAASFGQTFAKPGNSNIHSLRRNTWQTGVTAQWDFGVDTLGNLRSTKAQARQAEIELRNTQELAMMEIRQEMNNLTNSEEMVQALVVNQGAAREALRLVLVGYQAGVRTEVDVTDARKALTEVQGQYYSALTDHTKSRLNLQVAMGVLGPRFINDGVQVRSDIPIANIEEFAAKDYKAPEPITIPGIRPAADSEKSDSAPEARLSPATADNDISAMMPPRRNTEETLRAADKAVQDARETVARPVSGNSTAAVTTAKITVKPDRSSIARTNTYGGAN